MITMAIGDIYVYTLIIDRESCIGQSHYIRSLWQDHSDYTCQFRQLMVGSDQIRLISWDAPENITVTICADCNSWQWAQQHLDDSMRGFWLDQVNYTCRLWQLMVDSNKTRAIEREASDKIRAAICVDSDSWQWALTRPGRQHAEPWTRSWQLLWKPTMSSEKFVQLHK